MGDRMTPIPFCNLMEWIFAEKRKAGTVFGIRKPFVKKGDKALSIFGEKIETPFGAAAGPHTQLAQNLVAAYYSGNRFFELKTIQIIDGEDLPVSKPCILAEDEGYNCEWSTELTVPQARDEYVKAWIALKVISREFGLGADDGFIFNMSVGYDLEGIKSPKVNSFIDSMMEAKDTPVWKECIGYLLANADKFECVDKRFIESIPSKVCTSMTVSTLHGCPPVEIERIISYLLQEKHLNTYVKCNPTLLGYKAARGLMDDMGYKYLVFDDHHFKNDLQFEDAVPMLKRLQKKADDLKLEFGVKMTNTFPVKAARNELPSEEMYMSGRPLAVLSLSAAHKLSEAFDGKLRISFSGGADYFNIDRIFEAGIWPITMATTYLKSGGYERSKQIAEKLETMDYKPFDRIDIKGLEELIEDIKVDRHHTKSPKPVPSRKMDKKVPLLDCFTAPCSEECPINQDIPAYLKLVGEGKYKEALEVILDKNPLPFTTGTICYHTCMNKCTRTFYEEPVAIRSAKLAAAEKGYDELMKEIKPSGMHKNKKVAVIGGGPAGIASAFFLAREGAQVTVFEKSPQLGGVVTSLLSGKISKESVDKDIEIAVRMGAEFELNHTVTDLKELWEAGYGYIIIAAGALKGKVNSEYIKALGLELDEAGTDVLEPNVYVAGDCINGTSTVVLAISDASKAVNAILGLEPRPGIESGITAEEAAAKKGILVHSEDAGKEAERCLECGLVCESCVDVCPNRANVSVKLPGRKMAHVIHVDYMCNECGNCTAFCPYDSSPYKEKFTLFANEADFSNSENQGFVLLGEEMNCRVRLEDNVQDVCLKSDRITIPEGIADLIRAVCRDYSYLLGKIE
jgi:putative selenate reductase